MSCHAQTRARAWQRMRANGGWWGGVSWVTTATVQVVTLTLSLCWGDTATMSASLSTTSVAPPFNGTTGLNADTRAAIYEFRVFNMVVLSLAVFIVTVTAVLCCVSFLSRRRGHKRAQANQSTVGLAEEEEPVNAQVRRKRRGFRNPLALFQRQEPTRDNSHIYYIYSNPLPVGHQEDHPSTPQAPATPLTLQDYANDPDSGVILDPPTFYMQL